MLQGEGDFKLNNFGNAELELGKKRSATDRGPEVLSGAPMLDILTEDYPKDDNKGSSPININIESIQLKNDSPTPLRSGEKVMERTGSQPEAGDQKMKAEPARTA